MTVAKGPDAIRHREFREAVRLLTQTPWDGWPVAGPRTLGWCLRFIAESDTHPRGRHLRWRTATGLGAGDPGVAEHERAMRVIEHALCFDQLMVTQLAYMELVIRRAQLIELKHKSRVLCVRGSEVEEDEHLYMGTGETRGLLMIAPALEEFVAGELGRQAAAAKERRKMREERCLAKAPPPAKR